MKRKDALLKISLFIYNKLKPIETFKENLKQEFLKIDKKFHQISKRQKNISSKNPASKKQKNLRLIATAQFFIFFQNFNMKKILFAWSKIMIFVNLTQYQQLSEKNSMLKCFNRSNGTIKHLLRSEERASLLNSKISFKETPKKNKENKSLAEEYNEELISAINFLNNL